MATLKAQKLKEDEHRKYIEDTLAQIQKTQKQILLQLKKLGGTDVKKT